MINIIYFFQGYNLEYYKSKYYTIIYLYAKSNLTIIHFHYTLIVL